MKKLEDAKAKLMFENPFFGMLASKLEITENNNIASYKANGDRLIINSEYLDMLTLSEASTILANSAMHQMLFHKERSNGKVESIWHLASDYAINDLLFKNGFDIPPLSNFHSRFENLYTEEIYKILITELDIKEQEEAENIIEDSEYELFLEQIIDKYAKLNELPNEIEQFIDIKRVSKISWQKMLYKYINYHAKLDYTMYPSNKKYLWQSMALPSINSDELKIAIAIDTSASINQEQLEQFLSEVQKIMQSFKNYKILLIEADYKIQKTTILTPAMRLKSDIKGGGSTDFRAVFKLISNSKDKYKFLIYFTDAEGIFPEKKQKIDTLWVVTKDNPIPFGKKIVLDKQNLL